MYTDPILKKYRELFEARLPGVINTYYQGDPFRIPKSGLPALIIAKAQTNVQPLTNAEDDHRMAIVIRVITDIRDERNDDQTTIPGIAQLYDIIEGRQEVNYNLKTNSILNILRTNQIVDATYNLRTDLGAVTRVVYPERVRSPDGYMTEGRVEFLATYSQIR